MGGMKIRTSFVSNSSSSSYVCDITGEAFEVNDGCFWDVGLRHCVNGHTYKEEFALASIAENLTKDDMLKALEERTDSKRECKRLRDLTIDELRAEYREVTGTDGEEVPENCCPICTLNEVPIPLLVAYLLKEARATRKETTEIIKHRFGTFDKFAKYISQSPIR